VKTLREMLKDVMTLILRYLEEDEHRIAETICVSIGSTMLVLSIPGTFPLEVRQLYQSVAEEVTVNECLHFCSVRIVGESLAAITASKTIVPGLMFIYDIGGLNMSGSLVKAELRGTELA